MRGDLRCDQTLGRPWMRKRLRACWDRFTGDYRNAIGDALDITLREGVLRASGELNADLIPTSEMTRVCASEPTAGCASPMMGQWASSVSPRGFHSTDSSPCVPTLVGTQLPL